MKARLADVLAWLAFIHGLFSIFEMTASVISVGNPFDIWYFSYLFEFNIVIGSEGLLVSPVIWLLLYIVTGSPRLPPWRRPAKSQGADQ